MAIEKKSIKYWLTGLKLTSIPGITQYVKIDYAEYPTDYNQNIWESLGNNISVNPDGSFNERIEFNDLADNTEYIIRITDKVNNKTYIKFKTGTTVGLSDSPYYNKVLFPGQIYDFYDLDYTAVGIPNRSEVPRWYYPCVSKAECNIDNVENWGSLTGMTTEGSYWVNTLDAPANEKFTDKQGYSLSGFVFRNSDTADTKLWLALPNLKYDETTKKWVAWKYYDSADGGGGISASDCWNATFAIYIDDSVTTAQILACYDVNKTKNAIASNTTNKKWELILTEDCKLQVNVNDTVVATGNNILEKNRWYLLNIDHLSGHIYTMNPPQEDNNQGFVILNEPNIKTYPMEPTVNSTGSAGVVPYCLGSPTTNGIVIKSVCSSIMDDQLNAVVNKILNPEKYGLKLKLSGTTKQGETWEYLTSNKLNLKNSTDKISFCIDPDLFTKIDAIKNKDYLNSGTIKISIMSGDEELQNKTFEGFSYIDVANNQRVNISGIVNPATYVQDSFALEFATCEEPVTALAQYFFTKHGTWGGYNGGVNGNNIYFNQKGNLILECHGDNYTGSLRGVGKENLMKPYTGYGGDVDYSNNSWDLRRNKLTARTGTAIVSNKYFSYGKTDITMKIPKGIWGVCPAIWFFHYIEIGDTDARYNQEPYNQRNAQGSADDGYYRVVNNEIDIELPSHLTNGVLPAWYDINRAYFDKEVLDDELRIGVASGSDKGLFRLTNVENPNIKDSWTKERSTYNPRYKPSFQNIKFNNWVGELYAGNGWCMPEGSSTAEETYKGTSDETKDIKEEYLSQLTHGTDYSLGFADDNFHKWSIVWLPDRTLLYIDDVFVRENRGFVPHNIMKLTVAGWFPTMKKTSTGVIDSDGIHGSSGEIITNLNNTKDTSIGTWAGTQADFDVLHLEISKIEYTKYNVGDDITINGKTTHIESEPYSFGESFPESGLRMFVN